MCNKCHSFIHSFTHSIEEKHEVAKEESTETKEESTETKESEESEAEVKSEPSVPPRLTSSVESIKVKSFEEIMREKKLRKVKSQSDLETSASCIATPADTTSNNTVSLSKVLASRAKGPRRVTVQQEKPAEEAKVPAQSKEDKVSVGKGRRIIRVIKTTAQPTSTGKLLDCCLPCGP